MEATVELVALDSEAVAMATAELVALDSEAVAMATADSAK